MYSGLLSGTGQLGGNKLVAFAPPVVAQKAEGDCAPINWNLKIAAQISKSTLSRDKPVKCFIKTILGDD